MGTVCYLEDIENKRSLCYFGGQIKHLPLKQHIEIIIVDEQAAALIASDVEAMLCLGKHLIVTHYGNSFDLVIYHFILGLFQVNHGYLNVRDFNF